MKSWCTFVGVCVTLFILHIFLISVIIYARKSHTKHSKYNASDYFIFLGKLYSILPKICYAAPVCWSTECGTNRSKYFGSLRLANVPLLIWSFVCSFFGFSVVISFSVVAWVVSIERFVFHYYQLNDFLQFIMLLTFIQRFNFSFLPSWVVVTNSPIQHISLIYNFQSIHLVIINHFSFTFVLNSTESCF